MTAASDPSTPGDDRRASADPTDRRVAGDDAAADRDRARLQHVQAEVERRRRRPLVRLAIALGRLSGTTGSGGLRSPRAAEQVDALAGDRASAAVALGRRQVLTDLAREQDALRALDERRSLRLASAIDRRLLPADAPTRAPRRPRSGPTRPSPAIHVTVAAPTARAARRWGDHHLAVALAGELDQLGVATEVHPADGATTLGAGDCEVHLVVRGLRRIARRPGSAQVLWIISHPEQVTDAELDESDLVLVASELFASHLRHRTATPVEVLLQATDPRRFSPRPPDPACRHRLLIVANARHVRRPVVDAALEVGLRPAIYGSGWRGLVDPDLVRADHVPNDQLADLYCSADVVLADHWGTMRAWGFLSNRLLDVLACGVPVVSDHLPEIDALFGDAVPTWRTPHELAAAVEEVWSDPEAARHRALGGRRVVLAGHTMGVRAQQLLDALVEHDLLTPPLDDGRGAGPRGLG